MRIRIRYAQGNAPSKAETNALSAALRKAGYKVITTNCLQQTLTVEVGDCLCARRHDVWQAIRKAGIKYNNFSFACDRGAEPNAWTVYKA